MIPFTCQVGNQGNHPKPLEPYYSEAPSVSRVSPQVPFRADEVSFTIRYQSAGIRAPEPWPWLPDMLACGGKPHGRFGSKTDLLCSGKTTTFFVVGFCLGVFVVFPYKSDSNRHNNSAVSPKRLYSSSLGSLDVPKSSVDQFTGGVT